MLVKLVSKTQMFTLCLTAPRPCHILAAALQTNSHKPYDCRGRKNSVLVSWTIALVRSYMCTDVDLPSSNFTGSSAHCQGVKPDVDFLGPYGSLINQPWVHDWQFLCRRSISQFYQFESKLQLPRLLFCYITVTLLRAQHMKAGFKTFLTVTVGHHCLQNKVIRIGAKSTPGMAHIVPEIRREYPKW